MTGSDDRVSDVVLYHLTDVTGIPPERIHLTDRVVRDLKVTGDDIDFIFIPRVERDLGVTLKPHEWIAMRTVEEVITALRIAVRNKQHDTTSE